MYLKGIPVIPILNPNHEGSGGDNNSNNSNPSSVHEPGSEPKPKPEDTSKVLAKALTQLTEFVDPDRQEAPGIKVKEPDQFDSSDQQKLWEFLLQLKLNFQPNKKSFWSNSDKVNYTFFFLNGTALNYFEPYLMDNADQEPTWCNDYDEFIEELMINFGLYN